MTKQQINETALSSFVRRKLSLGIGLLAVGTMMPLAAHCRRLSDRDGQHHRPRRHRRHRDGRHPPFHHRHHGDLRNRLGPGRKARHRADQRIGRRARPQDRIHPGRRRHRLADLRREGQEAAGQRQGRRGLRLLDLGLAQGRAAGLRAVQRHALLPDLLRGPRGIAERHLHRPGSHPADPRRPRLGREGEERQDLLPARLRLHLAAHLQQDRPQAHREDWASRSSARSTTRSATPSSIRSSTRSS